MLTRWCFTILLKQNITFQHSFEEGPASTHIQAERMFSEDRGRPSFFISKEHLDFFLSYDFHCPEIK